jgi:hypothetical protein
VNSQRPPAPIRFLEIYEFAMDRLLGNHIGAIDPVQTHLGSRWDLLLLDHYAWRYHCRDLFQMPIAA